MAEARSGEAHVLARDGLGERLRALRRAAGLSQAQLAGGRFSKEYVSQLELGKARPSLETLAWLAARLGTDPAYLATGVSAADAERADAAIANAEELSGAHRHRDAAQAFAAARLAAVEAQSPVLVLRALRGAAWSHLRLGALGRARALVDDARALVEELALGELEEAEIAYLEGLCRYTESDVAGAVESFGAALRLAERSGLPSDRLRADALGWRSRCYRRLRDWEAAREDVERALELAGSRGDPRQTAEVLFQASLVAQREGRWVLARARAREARALYERLGDRVTATRLLNNIAGLDHLLGHAQEAIAQLHEAFDTFITLGEQVDAGYVLASLADIYLDTGDAARAEPLARRALEILDGRVEHLQEIGTAELALGRALAALGREAEAREQLAAADAVFERASSPSHRAEAWIAEGDLARDGGDDREAALLYRRAAQALLDVSS